MTAPLVLLSCALLQQTPPPDPSVEVQEPTVEQAREQARSGVPTPQQAKALEARLNARIQALESARKKSSEELAAAREEIALLQTELTAMKSRDAQARNSLAKAAATVQDVAVRLERLDTLLVQGSDEAPSELDAARAVVADGYDNLRLSPAVSQLIEGLEAARQALDNDDYARARSRIWDAAVALLEVSGEVNVLQNSP